MSNTISKEDQRGNQNNALNTCGCCEGTESVTPATTSNRPGLSALSVRVGTHGGFKESMQAALSGEPELGELTTRSDDDPALALLDGWAAVLDILSFYQERIANEGYLRTATERRSVMELARHVGYTPRPGAAASVDLQFTLEANTVPGLKTEAEIPSGTKTQSVPGQDQLPQVFETIEDMEAEAQWDAMEPKQFEMIYPQKGEDTIYLKGMSTQLNRGDALLIIGDERKNASGSEKWDFRKVEAVETVKPTVKSTVKPTVLSTDPDAGYTVVTLTHGLGSQDPAGDPAALNPKVYALRKKAAPFGHNAPDCRLLHTDIAANFELNGDGTEWANLTIRKISPAEKTVCLDAIYPKIMVGSWVVLSKRTMTEVYEVTDVKETAKKDFTLSATVTRLTLDGEYLDTGFDDHLRETVVYGESEELTFAKTPITDPLKGKLIVLDSLVTGLKKDRRLVVTGKPIRAKMTAAATVVLTINDDGDTETRVCAAGDEWVVTAPPKELEGGGDVKEWRLKADMVVDGVTETIEGTVKLDENLLDYIPAEEEDDEVSEMVTLSALQGADESHSQLLLTTNLQYIYDRTTVKISANLAKATHGETKTEILGGGDGSKVFQQFQLKQTPLTYVSASTASGTETTLEIRVNDILWEEVSTFYQVEAEARVYVSRIADDGTVAVMFGDGITGSRLPTGSENVVATYRVGIGFDGHVNAQQISMIMSPQLGVKSVSNPLAPSGGDDPETRDKARENAPMTVLTMDRIVSLRDFEDFARAFTGIGKASAQMLWKGEGQLVHITVATTEGKGVSKGTDPYDKLVTAIDAARHERRQVKIGSFREKEFGVEAKVKVNRLYTEDIVKTDVVEALREAFSFDVREFMQSVTPSEVMAVIHSVEGVVAVDLEKLGGDDPFSKEHFRITAEPAQWKDKKKQEIILAAELLTIDTDDITIETESVTVTEAAGGTVGGS